MCNVMYKLGIIPLFNVWAIIIGLFMEAEGMHERGHNKYPTLACCNL